MMISETKEGRSEKNIQELEETYALSQGNSIRRAAVELDISRLSIQQMLCKDIKFQIVHKLEEDRSPDRKSGQN